MGIKFNLFENCVLDFCVIGYFLQPIGMIIFLFNFFHVKNCSVIEFQGNL